MGKAQKTKENQQKQKEDGVQKDKDGSCNLDFSVFKQGPYSGGLAKCSSKRPIIEDNDDSYDDEPLPDILLPLAGLGFDVKVNDSLVAIKMTQSFLNPTAEQVNQKAREHAGKKSDFSKEDEKPLEVAYNFPKLDSKAVVTKLRISIGDDRIIDAKVEPKKKAQEKYDDATA